MSKEKEKGKYVNRSTFQKVVEENKKFRSYIEILVEEGIPSFEKIQLTKKLRDEIKANKDLNQKVFDLVGEIVKQEKAIVHSCGGAKCTILNCNVCKNQINRHES